MAEFTGLHGSTFDRAKFSKLFEENCGGEFTTESILASMERTAPLFTGELVSMIKESGMYIEGAVAEK